MSSKNRVRKVDVVVSRTKPRESMLEEFGDCAHSEFNIPDPENQVQFEILNLLLCNGLLVVCTCIAGHASFVVICDFYNNCISHSLSHQTFSLEI